MKREYLEKNVYEACMERLHFIFEEFDNILVSFSGGKDSGLLLNLVLDYKKKYYPDKTIGVFHQDFEAQYTVTTEYIERTLERIKDEAEIYWVCLPMATRTALSSYEMYWYPWDDTKPVSYTHLDVYKRQRQIWAGWIHFIPSSRCRPVSRLPRLPSMAERMQEFWLPRFWLLPIRSFFRS